MSSPALIELTDTDLIQAFQSGREEAFNSLMARHKEKALQLAWLKTGHWEDAKDISQDAFVKAYHALKDFRGQAKFSTWFYTLVMNTARDYWRRKHPLRWLSWNRQEDMDLFFETLPSAAPRPDRALESRETQARVQRACAGLPERQRLIFSLRFFQDLPLAEIAQILNISEGTVKAGLHFAIQKFKTEFSLPEAKGQVRSSFGRNCPSKEGAK